MKSLMIFAGGLLGLIPTVFAGLGRPGPVSWANTSTTASTITASIITTNIITASISFVPVPTPWTNTTTTALPDSKGCGHGSSSASLNITSSTIPSAQPSIYTPIPSDNTDPVNSTVQPIRWHLYGIRASVNKKAESAHYTFRAAIKPPCSNYSVVCQQTVHTEEDQLAEVHNTRCRNPTGTPYKNASIPVTFHFEWRPDVKNSFGEKGNLLVIRSNSPGSAHACPLFPYDACWAQGIHWVPESQIGSTFVGDKYIGPHSIHLNGTYCKTGMPECIWSEYLY
ncbi:hypothetical protein KVR01_011080 [Diaporthe batatas]|uniref:uncharacterized protein n=1 Tax=Diaporthe batatas TaxID=748121 RepID=UPI001D04E39C|nr:uncharacterized protein KVR01_011080 [Diaporthe batatas]KAG8159419.1 hypothetical protein KVR01_011080 [Diaporthe batatas]